MSITTEDYGFLKSERWHSFLECTAQGLQLCLSIVILDKPVFQSSRICPVCQSEFQDAATIPDLQNHKLSKVQETIDLRTEDTLLTFPLGSGIRMIAQECLCVKETVYPKLLERATIAAKLLTNFLASFKHEFNCGQRALELSILRQMNHIVISLFHGDTDALKKSLELILSALIILLEAEGSWVQIDNQGDPYIKGDEFLVKAYLTGAEGTAQHVDITYGQSKCNLGVLSPVDKEHSGELISLMAQECAIILEIDNLFRLLNNQLARVLGEVGSAVFIINQRKTITYINKAAENLLNRTFLNLVGVSILDIEGPWVSIINSEIGFPVNGQMESLQRDQEEDKQCWVDWQVSPIFEDKVIVGWLIMLDDRSDFYRWQSAARQAERFATTSMMVGALAHELRNPLSAAKGLLQLMTRKRNQVQTAGYVDLVLREIDRVTRLLNEFLLLGKPAAILPEPLDLISFIEELSPLLEGEAIGTDIQVLVDYSKGVAPINADAGQLTQVILNLVRNAVQSVVASERENGLVKISLDQGLDKVELCIEDNGSGFAPGIIEQLFTPFFTTKERGTGLGLAVVKAIINNHEGEIEASNKPEGGAIFKILLPNSCIAEIEVDVALIINDLVLSYSLEKALKVLDYRVKVFKMSALNRDILSKVLPNQVVIEGLIDEEKLIVIEEIHKQLPEAKFMVLGDLPEAFAKRLEEKGFKIIKKPADINQIVSRIRNIDIKAIS
ncbi:ATP-binding protein [Desulfosporosinus sp. HMP52]|uniref:two-component system sensor histidine kinase NtrB n=1 Tax=Desulfosporosinus sp. HMP52 TaxID=1487923 RepID=UPI000692465E|nr:ATP-binding protein [Desulfosporosinus sp. HMP52]